MGQPRSHVGPQFYWPFHIFSIRPASVTWQRTYATLKVLNYFFDHLHQKHVPLAISFYIWQMRQISSGIESCTYAAHQRFRYGMWAKIFNYHLFSSVRECQLTVSVTPNFCVIYTVNHLLFWPYSGFIFHFIQPNCQLLLTSMVLLHLFWKYVPSAIPMLDTEIMWPLSVPEQCIASGKKPQHSKNNNPKTRDELSVESVPHSNPNHNL